MVIQVLCEGLGPRKCCEHDLVKDLDTVQVWRGVSTCERAVVVVTPTLTHKPEYQMDISDLGLHGLSC